MYVACKPSWCVVSDEGAVFQFPVGFKINLPTYTLHLVSEFMPRGRMLEKLTSMKASKYEGMMSRLYSVKQLVLPSLSWSDSCGLLILISLLAIFLPAQHTCPSICYDRCSGMTPCE